MLDFDFTRLSELQVLATETKSILSINVSRFRISVDVHGPLGLTLREQAAATPGEWYGLTPVFVGQPARPQRAYKWEAKGISYTAYETAKDLGLTREDCIAQNKAAEAAKSEAA